MQSQEEAVAVAEKIGFPVMIKVRGRALVHPGGLGTLGGFRTLGFTAPGAPGELPFVPLGGFRTVRGFGTLGPLAPGAPGLLTVLYLSLSLQSR